eukprot:gene12111-8335_t
MLSCCALRKTMTDSTRKETQRGARAINEFLMMKYDVSARLSGTKRRPRTHVVESNLIWN